jgi:hypothetical protein
MIVRRVTPLSLAKVSAIIHAIVGLVAGAMFALISHNSVGQTPRGALPDMIFGAGALIFMPIAYGILGFLISLIAAVLYNAVAKVVGGVEIHTERDG